MAVIGTVTARPGSSESVTVMATSFSATLVVAGSSDSATVYASEPNATVTDGSSSSVAESSGIVRVIRPDSGLGYPSNSAWTE